MKQAAIIVQKVKGKILYKPRVEVRYMLQEKLKIDVYRQNTGQEEGKVANKFQLTNNVNLFRESECVRFK